MRPRRRASSLGAQRQLSGGQTRQLSLRPQQVPQVRKALQRYRAIKETLEAISELNQQLLRMDRDESKERPA